MTPHRWGAHPTHQCKLAIQIAIQVIKTHRIMSTKKTILWPGHQFLHQLRTLVLGNESGILPLWLAPHRAKWRREHQKRKGLYSLVITFVHWLSVYMYTTVLLHLLILMYNGSVRPTCKLCYWNACSESGYDVMAELQNMLDKKVQERSKQLQFYHRHL